MRETISRIMMFVCGYKAQRLRQEDAHYVQKIEEEELNLELKRLTVFEEKIKIAKQLGLRNKDLAPLVRTLVADPRKQLEQFADDVIDSADVHPPEGEDPDVPSRLRRKIR